MFGSDQPHQYHWISGLVAALPDGVLVVNSEGAVVLSNSRAEELFGYDPGEILGQQVECLVPDDVRSRHPALRATYFAQPMVRTMGSGLELNGKRKDGSTFPIDISLSSIEAGGRSMAIAVMRDATEHRRRKAEAIQESEDRFKQLAESIQEVFWMSDPTTGEMLYISPAYDTIWQRSRAEVLESSEAWAANVHPEDRDRVSEAARERRVLGEYDEEYRIIRPDGSVRWIADRGFPIRGQDGSVTRIAGVARDITDEKTAEETLTKLNLELEQRAEQLAGELSRFFNVSIDMLCISSVDGYFKRLSPSFTDSLGWTIEEMMGIPYMELVHPEDIASTHAEVERQILRGEVVMSFENRYRHKDGSYRVLSWKSAPQEEGLMFAVARDITNQKEQEAELRQAKIDADQANQAKSEFLSRMSHELRTPLNAVLGFSQLLELHYDDPRILEAARAITRGGRHLLELVNEVLELSKIESGNLSISVESVAVTDVVNKALAMLKPLAAAAEIQLSFDERFCSSLYVSADRQRLLQILVNLINNAIKYNHSGGYVSVNCSTSSAFGFIDVEDSGEGFSKEDQRFIFEPFHRFGDPNIEGTGLGLALAKRFATAMAGNLELHRTSREGSTFRVTMQLAESQVEKSNVATQRLHSTTRLDLKGTVLCIEDNPSNLRLIELALASWPSVALLPAAQGLVGLDLARQHLPDLILLDLHLPDVGGERVLQKLLAEEATKDIPVVVISADATHRQIENLLSMGAKAYLTKPLNLEEFFVLLENHLEKV